MRCSLRCSSYVSCGVGHRSRVRSGGYCVKLAGIGQVLDNELEFTDTSQGLILLGPHSAC